MKCCLCRPGVNSKSARVLLMLVVPGHLVFLYAISLLQGEEAPISVAFTICYLCAALLQVSRLILAAFDSEWFLMNSVALQSVMWNFRASWSFAWHSDTNCGNQSPEVSLCTVWWKWLPPAVTYLWNDLCQMLVFQQLGETKICSRTEPKARCSPATVTFLTSSVFMSSQLSCGARSLIVWQSPSATGGSNKSQIYYLPESRRAD